MTPVDWAQVRSLFHSLFSLHPGQRAARIASIPESKADIRSELERLFEENQRAPDYLNPPSPAAPVRRASLRSGEIIGARYEVVEFLGAGGMGEVYKVRDLELRETLALKTLRADADASALLAGRMRKEVQLARRILHPNVCRVLDFGRAERGDGELVFLTMELLEGRTLSDAIKERPLTIPEALPIARQMISGLAAAHGQGILHRDLKSANIMLIGERAVIMDFGLARKQDTQETFSAFGTGAIVGTPAYMPPEQLQGKPLTAAADIHALGAVLYEMVTGQLPFPGETPLAIALKRLQKQAPSPRDLVRDIDTAWESAILACLHRNPLQRPQFVEAVLAMLEGRVAPKSRFSRRIAIGSVAAVMGAGAFAVFRPKAIQPEADRSFKRAEEFARRRTASDLKNAVQEYERAIALQPDMAPAWTGLANSYSALSEFGLMNAKEGNAKAIDAAQRAITLDSRSARAHGVIGYITSNDLTRWQTAEAYFQRAVSYGSKDPMVHLWYASFLGKSGRSEEALAHIRAGLDEDPSHFTLNQQLAAELYRARRFDDCYTQAVELERLQPYEGGTHFMLARALERKGLFKEAMERCDIAVKYGLGERLVDAMRSLIQWSSGQARKARDLADAAELYWRDKPMATIHVATAYGHMGDFEKTIDLLLAGCDREDASVLGADRHPLLEGLHGVPRYGEFLRRIGLT